MTSSIGSSNFRSHLRYRLNRARAVLVLPNPGTVATVSEYLQQWGVVQDAGQDFREAMSRVKQRNESLKERGKPIPTVSLIIADIDGSIENSRRRVPENMLLRKNLRKFHPTSNSLRVLHAQLKLRLCCQNVRIYPFVQSEPTQTF